MINGDGTARLSMGTSREQVISPFRSDVGWENGTLTHCAELALLNLSSM